MGRRIRLAGRSEMPTSVAATAIGLGFERTAFLSCYSSSEAKEAKADSTSFSQNLRGGARGVGFCSPPQTCPKETMVRGFGSAGRS
jgi:hypothetical protein